MKMKGTRREMGSNRARVKWRLIPLARGIHLYPGLCVAAGSAVRKEAMEGGLEGRCIHHHCPECLIFQRLSLNKFLL